MFRTLPTHASHQRQDTGVLSTRFHPLLANSCLIGSNSIAHWEEAGSPMQFSVAEISKEGSRRLRWHAVTARWVWAYTELPFVAAIAIGSGLRQWMWHQTPGICYSRQGISQF